MFWAGVLLVLLGLPAALLPYPIARFSERTDAIGSKTSWVEVEPADWKVTFTRVGGVVFVGGGVAAALG